MSDLQQQLDFLLELDKSKSVYRQTYLSDGSRKENDAEHSWHLAVMVMLLSDYANEKIDVLRTLKMVLLHDIIEIDAGDTYAYDVKANETKETRERLAADRLYGLLPQPQKEEYLKIWEEFEAMDTPEARFANTIDKLQPVMLTNAANGKSWKEHQVKESQIMGRNVRTHEGSEEIWQHFKKIIEENIENGNISKD